MTFDHIFSGPVDGTKAQEIIEAYGRHESLAVLFDGVSVSVSDYTEHRGRLWTSVVACLTPFAGTMHVMTDCRLTDGYVVFTNRSGEGMRLKVTE